MLTLPFALLGLIVGSFLNVAVLRYPEKSLGGRSKCPQCGHHIRWYDNIPVISWFLLCGRCRDCKARISMQYPIVELLTGVIFALFAQPLFMEATTPPFAFLGVISAAAYLAAATLLIAIAVYDLRTTIMPNAWVYAFDALAFFSALSFMFPSASEPSFALLAGPVCALPLFLLWLFSRGRAMGFGDVKLALGIGWLLGPVYGLAAIFFAFVLGALIGVALIALTHIRARVVGSSGFTMKSEIPFGPFLAASVFIVWLMLLHNIDPLALVGLSSW